MIKDVLLSNYSIKWKKTDTNLIANKYLESASVENPTIRLSCDELSSNMQNQRRIILLKVYFSFILQAASRQDMF